MLAKSMSYVQYRYKDKMVIIHMIVNTTKFC